MANPSTEIRNLKLTLRFVGTAYHGWQVQKNAPTVQETLQDALQAVLGERPGVTGCSRTDAGVHANEYICNFRTMSCIPCENLRRALNANLPRDIAVRACDTAGPEFHARYSACGKEYIYKVWNEAARDPFLEGYALTYSYPLDLPAMQTAAEAFLGEHDFQSFCAAGSSVQDTVRHVTLFEVTRDAGLVQFRVRADGFLYNMVRIMVGTLLSVSQGRIGSGDIPDILQARNRAEAGPTAPAHGLYLNKVFYDAVEVCR